MTDFTKILLPKLAAHRLDGFLLDEDMQAPFYQGHCLANLPASICAWLGREEWPTVPLDESYARPFRRQYDQVILLVVDGMGLELFQKGSADESAESRLWQNLLAESCLFPLTSIVPSTTSAALTSFWTGRTAAEHGILGYEMWLREFNLAANMITQSPAFFEGAVGSLRQAGFDPSRFLTVPTLGPFFKQAGVETFALQHNAIARSGLSTMLFDQVQSVPFRGLNDLSTTLEELACTETMQKRYIYAYWGDLDELQHVYGPNDLRVQQEFRSLQRAMIRLFTHLKQNVHKKTLVLVTADHGQKQTQVLSEYNVNQAEDFIDCLHLLPTGESRLPYLHIRPGYAERVREIVETRWPGKFLLLSSDQAASVGLFGPTPYHTELFSRLGDLILIARKDAYLYWPQKENSLKGRHGGLSRSEMLTPLLIFDC